MSDEQICAGHNSTDKRLLSFLERIENIEIEQEALATDKSEIYQEVKSAGYDTKVLRALVKERKQDPDKLETHVTLLDIYRRAIENLNSMRGSE